ncbi:uncharacterized protein LOC118203844 [Stegodyphus dumicola]|uniref:uncharacterized protein LOC118203844 n=1 Tax=Stegodyphus dumicola TaxID=202533 RepID=UPI0015A80420|nr:uncharacterized protein LOC118203844 [Stegodyphus dumicola]
MGKFTGTEPTTINTASLLISSLLVKGQCISDLWKLDVLGISEPSVSKTKTQLQEDTQKYFEETLTVNSEGRAVVKENSSTSIRPVFNASSHSPGYPSLNDCLSTGPNLIEIIPSILNRFRKNYVGVTSDIEKAFLQISIREKDRDFLRFMWFSRDNQEQVELYRHGRVVFGITCSPFWKSNIRSVVPEEDSSTEGDVSVLGLVWHTVTDTLSCKISQDIKLDDPVTKRLVLAVAHQVFDVIGYTAPVMLIPKLILQETWNLRLKWDDVLPDELTKKFRFWLKKLYLLSSIQIPRWVGLKSINEAVSIHLFCDSSKSAYGACVFLRVQSGKKVKEIRSLTSPTVWRHVPGSLNPADLLSRGCYADQLIERKWWEGPDWLREDEANWPKSNDEPDEDLVNSEIRRASLGYEELLTVLCDCERIVNSRPLTYVSDDIEDPLPLTPEKFLHETPQSGVPDIDNVDKEKLICTLFFHSQVKSLLADTDDTSCESYIRPVRAYSMGSRPQPKKSHLQMQVDGSRMRAYSVGSQAQKKVSNPLERELGNLMRIDPRTGAKSSSAPLLNNRPPRIRSSTSRGDVGEDLMEIDYNNAKYSSKGFDLCDSNFTIEPVGRSRSGSYSSSSNSAMKLLHDRDKAKSHSTGHSCNPIKDDLETSDYLRMSPLSDSTKSTTSNNTSLTASKSDTPTIKKAEHLHPPGDYVSLDPTCTYQTMANTSLPYTFVKTSSGISVESASYNKKNSAPVVSNTSVSEEKSKDLNDSTSLTSTAVTNNNVPVNFHSSLAKETPSDYMCMDYRKNSEKKATVCDGRVITNDHSSIDVSNTESKCAEKIDSSQHYDRCRKNQSSSLQQVKGSSKPTSPASKSPPYQAAGTVNFLPKTPPPSPSYGAMSFSVSGVPLMENVVRRLSQPTNAAATQSAPNSRPNSVCGEIRLNYASLDLPPASEEENKNTAGRLKSSLEAEAKETPLTYAQIDFSPVRQKAFQEAESLSHL